MKYIESIAKNFSSTNFIYSFIPRSGLALEFKTSKRTSFRLYIVYTLGIMCVCERVFSLSFAETYGNMGTLQYNAYTTYAAVF